MKHYLGWILCFWLFMPVTLSAEIFTWKDDRGTTHFTNLPYSVHPGAQVVTFGVMNYMLAVDVDTVDWNLQSKKTNPKASFLDEVKQCNQWRIELVNLKDKLKKGYTLKEAKRLKAKKLALKDQIWRECR